MTHKEQIQSAIIKELRVSQRLFSLLPKDLYDYKPQEGMRTTLQLLQSMMIWGAFPVESYLMEDTELRKTLYKKYDDESKTIKPDDFLKKMDEQIEKIGSLLKNVSDEDLLNKTVTVVWREEMPLGRAILETSLKWVTGYKMQLFLYAKQSGLKDIDTGDAWIMQYGDE